MSINLSCTLATALFALLAMPGTALPQSSLPSPQTQNAIQSLSDDVRGSKNVNKKLEIRELTVDPSRLPQTTREKLPLNAEGQARVPFIVPNTLIVQFQPNATRESIEAFLKGRNLKVMETFPGLGAVKVEGDLSNYFKPELTDNNANQTLLRGIGKVIEDYTKDPLVRSATPDLVLQPHAVNETMTSAEIGNLLKASDVGALVLADSQEKIDWGVTNIEADQLWKEAGAQDGAIFGVLDVGFSRHEDITFLELPRKMDAADHGNHVSAIGCGRHGNGVGIRGVLPNCFVRARTANVFFESVEGSDVLKFLVIFSQVVATLDRYLSDFDDIRTYNISMGMNWRRNFNISPDSPDAAIYRSLIEQQGTLLVTALERADKAGKVIFSAAGNDSAGLATPATAKFASPFNWAALTAREKGIARNGVIVEAHDSSNKRAGFSNVGGHLSCPGVDVLSAVAFDETGKGSPSRYGKMSGTSMASPYCASAHLLLGLVRPGYSGTELIDCLTASTVKSDTGVPIPKLTQALAKCPARNP